MKNELEYRERLNEKLSVIHRRDGVGTTTDALLLAAMLPTSAGSSCELGAGGGLISLLAAHREKIEIGVLVEREPILCELAERNIRENGLMERLSVFCADLRQSLPTRRFDTVFANPPYRRAGEGCPAREHLADISRFERAGGILDFCQAAAALLTDRGRFYTVFPATRRKELSAALTAAGLSILRTVRVLPYPDGAASLILTEAGRLAGAQKEECFTLCRGRGGAPTAEAERLYADGILITEGE